MDKNTITGIILIFAIFIGFSIYNGSRLNKGFENAVKIAESEVAAGNLERARTEYVNALRFKANNPEVLAKIEELNVKLGISTEGQVADTAKTENISRTDSLSVQHTEKEDANQYGAFAIAAKGDNEFITLENNKIQVKISTKGGRVYSALMKDYKTYNALPLILFSGDSTVFGFNFFTVDNKAVRTNNLFFKPVKILCCDR
jgi:YidC/Oxa1 family membrane protein insertase